VVWTKLNQTLGGKLLAPAPPAAACHQGEASFDAVVCAEISKAWTGDDFHVENPISSMWQQYNNDTCLPSPEAPCSASGYPAYVIDARSASDVQKGVNFGKSDAHISYTDRSVADSKCSSQS